MENYFKCPRFINPWPSRLETKDVLDRDTFLSINVAINDLPYIKNYIDKFINTLRGYLFSKEWLKNELDNIYIYPQESIHFTILAIYRIP